MIHIHWHRSKNGWYLFSVGGMLFRRFDKVCRCGSSKTTMELTK